MFVDLHVGIGCHSWMVWNNSQDDEIELDIISSSTDVSLREAQLQQQQDLMTAFMLPEQNRTIIVGGLFRNDG